MGREKWKFAPGFWRGRALSKVGGGVSLVAFCPVRRVSVHVPLELLAQSMSSSRLTRKSSLSQLWFIHFTRCQSVQFERVRVFDWRVMGSSKVSRWSPDFVQFRDSLWSSFLSLNIWVHAKMPLNLPMCPRLSPKKKKRKEEFTVEQFTLSPPKLCSQVWINVAEGGKMDTTFGAKSCIFLQTIFWKNLMSVWTLILTHSIQIQSDAAAGISLKSQSYRPESTYPDGSTWWETSQSVCAFESNFTR